MGNLPEPHEHMLYELHAIKRGHFELSMRDGVMCAKERAIQDQIIDLHAHITQVKTRKELSTLIDKGGDVSAYMNRKAAVLRMQIISLEDVRESRDKIVAFPTRNDDGIA